MALPPSRIAELKQIIHTHLTQFDLQSSISGILSEAMREKQAGQNISEDELLSLLQQRGVLDEIMSRLKIEPPPSGIGDTALSGTAAVANRHQPKPATRFVNDDDKLVSALPIKKANIDPTRRYLYVQIMGGKAFLDHLHEDGGGVAVDRSPRGGEGGLGMFSTLTVHLNFRGQRFRSRAVPCACEPDIQEGFLLELHTQSAGVAGKMADKTSMLSISDPVHLVLIKTEASGETHLISSHYLEWRNVLVAQSTRYTTHIELMGTGAENKVPIGVLEIRLELIPKPTSDHFSEEILSTQLSLEKAKRAERDRLFLVYAKQWWKEYLQIRSSHADRLVKIFAQDENCTNRPVCSYIRPMRASRLLDTPRQATRFVSLIGYEKTPSVGGSARTEQWTSMHAFLCRNKSDCEDHAVLLCNLLLGFGLDAYVCVGTKVKGTVHVWVATIATDGTTTFWESLTGNRYTHHSIDPADLPLAAQYKPAHPYRSIGCVFNHERFFANCQPTDDVELCVFNLYDESRWKAMSTDAVKSVCQPGLSNCWPSLPPLCPSILDPTLISNEMENDLRTLVSQHRKDQGLSTIWDDELSYLLTPALSAYETDRLTGVTAGNEEFQQAVRRAVPDGHTFKGYPIQFVHRNARRAFFTSLKSTICEEIVNCRGDHVRQALRVCVYTYPESTCATWVMFACKYKSVL